MYRRVANTARYSIDQKPDDLESTIERAVTEVILKHPSLCCGIVNEDKNDPYFVRLPLIDLTKCIEYRTLDASEDINQVVVDVLEQKHSTLWPSLQYRPGWDLTILQSQVEESDGLVFDAVFTFHHALVDGLGGMTFHRSLLHALNTSTNPELPSLIVTIPKATKLIRPVEELVDFRISWWFFFIIFWKVLKPKWLFPAADLPWAGEICSLENVKNYQSRVKFIEIPSGTLNAILGACRKEKSTLTGLLNGLITTSLTFRVPSGQKFVSCTPYSFRHLSGTSATEEIAVQVSSIELTYSAEIAALRTMSDPTQITAQVWEIARNFKTSLAAEIASLPNDNILGMLKYVKNLHSMIKGRLGSPRSETYELSNVGNLQPAESGAWNIERSIASQSGMATGPAFSFNVASVAGGPLTISTTWAQGDVEESIVDLVREDLKYALNCIGNGKDVSLGPFA